MTSENQVCFILNILQHTIISSKTQNIFKNCELSFMRHNCPTFVAHIQNAPLFVAQIYMQIQITSKGPQAAANGRLNVRSREWAAAGEGTHG